MLAAPGIHSNFEDVHYSADERKIIKRLALEWFVTSSTKPIELSEKSIYRGMLCKPADLYREMFHLEREVAVIFSSYSELEPRTIDAFEPLMARFGALRIEPICRILVSRDGNVEERIREFLKNDPELPIIVPFTYDELLYNRDPHLVENRFRSHFFSRDLFAFESPLKRDTYFFGRTDLINSILARHKSNENSGLFGLRRSGKTSIVYGLERASKLGNQSFVSIDCQSPSVHQRRWNDLLFYILNKVVEKYSLPKKTISSSNYTEIDAADSFFSDIRTLHGLIGRSPIMLAFDEIERISPKTGSSPHWRDGDDFVLFWQAVRSAFQRHTGIFSFLLIGTNPQAIETAVINHHDNPLFNSVPIEFIPGFKAEQTNEMVKRLGMYMGINFEDRVCSDVHNDFGGHPYLIRHVCSLMSKRAKLKRPVFLDRTIYQAAKKEFVENYANYTEMILDVLVRDFPDEYLLLEALALGDLETFNAFKGEHALTNHLRGYGLIEQGLEGYFFKIDSVRDHLRAKAHFRSPVKSDNERRVEVAARRTSLEPALRRLVLTIFRANFGKSAKTEFLTHLKGQTLARVQAVELAAALAPNSIETNLSDLAKVIAARWPLFQNMFSIKKEQFEFYIESIRAVRTEEAHSGKISDDDFQLARIAFGKMEQDLRDNGFMLPAAAQ